MCQLSPVGTIRKWGEAGSVFGPGNSAEQVCYSWNRTPTKNPTNTFHVILRVSHDDIEIADGQATITIIDDD